MRSMVTTKGGTPVGRHGGGTQEVQTWSVIGETIMARQSDQLNE